MKWIITQPIILICAILSLIVTSCNSQTIRNKTTTATATMVPTSSETSTPSPTLTPVPTVTPISLMVNGGSFPFSDTEISTKNIPYIRQITEIGLGDPLFITYSPDDSFLALITAGGWIRIFSIKDRTEIQRIKTDLPLSLEWLMYYRKCDACVGLAISPDNSLIAAASVDGTVKVWQISSGEKSVFFPSREFNQLDRNIFNQIYLTFISNSIIGIAHNGIVRVLYELNKGIVTEAVYPRLNYS